MECSFTFFYCWHQSHSSVWKQLRSNKDATNNKNRLEEFNFLIAKPICSINQIIGFQIRTNISTSIKKTNLISVFSAHERCGQCLYIFKQITTQFRTTTNEQHKILLILRILCESLDIWFRINVIAAEQRFMLTVNAHLLLDLISNIKIESLNKKKK